MKKRGRPLKETTKVRVNLTLDPDLYNEFERLCKETNQSKSSKINDFIRGLVKNNEN